MYLRNACFGVRDFWTLFRWPPTKQQTPTAIGRHVPIKYFTFTRSDWRVDFVSRQNEMAAHSFDGHDRRLRLTGTAMC